MTAQDADNVIEQALQESIEKWRRIIYHGKLDMGSSDCALCREFRNYKPLDVQCVGCPVMKITGSPHCAGSPYAEWERYHPHHTFKRVYSAKSKELAMDEYNFLRYLLVSYREKKETQK